MHHFSGYFYNNNLIAEKMKTNSNLNSNWSDNNISELVITKEEKMLDQLQPLSREVSEMVSEGGESFISYIKSIGLSREKNMVVLPSVHHYYFEKNDMAGIRTLVNLKSLNVIEHLDSFLNTLVSILPPNTNFIGCFSDNRKKSGKFNTMLNKSSMLLERFINLLDSRTVHFMNKNEVFQLLEKHGFNIVDMTEMNGLTYFYSQNAPAVNELRASLKAAVNNN
jgi:hypothetical protein